MKHCKCKECKVLFADGRATMDRTYEHIFWLGEKQVSRKEFYEHQEGVSEEICQCIYQFLIRNKH